MVMGRHAKHCTFEKRGHFGAAFINHEKKFFYEDYSKQSENMGVAELGVFLWGDGGS